MKKQLSDREQLVVGWEKKIKFHRQQLAKTKGLHREIEAKMVKRIKLEEMLLKSLRKK